MISSPALSVVQLEVLSGYRTGAPEAGTAQSAYSAPGTGSPSGSVFLKRIPLSTVTSAVSVSSR